MTYRMQVNRYRAFHNYHTWIISCAEEDDMGIKWWQALEITEGKTWIKVLIFKWKTSPHQFVCCCQISVPEKKVSFCRREEEGALRGRNVSHTCVHLCNMHHTCISICSPLYPSLLFNIRINVLNPKKKFGIQGSLILKTSAHFTPLKTKFLKSFSPSIF